jgi:hypothetical protein
MTVNALANTDPIGDTMKVGRPQEVLKFRGLELSPARLANSTLTTEEALHDEK